MGHHDPSEADWKIFRRLRDIALQRFCDRTLQELSVLIHADSRSPHERYLAVFDLVQKRNDELARAFDGAARSRMVSHLVEMHELGIVSKEELEQFGPETRRVLDFLVKGLRE
jgi:hypothetical protein